jgi:hypothetical protein
MFCGARFQKKVAQGIKKRLFRNLAAATDPKSRFREE